MPKALKLAGKILLIFLLVGILIWLAYWMTFVRQSPWWLAAAADSGILAVVIFIMWLRRYLVRRREKKFINRIIDQDNARIPTGLQRHEIIELQENWKESLKRLQHSSLRKHGNPLYVLPWYMIFGESGTGKTSAIRNSGLNTPMSEPASIGGVGGTRNCDWYFFEQAIILDTAGRYAIPLDEGPDLDEWKSFLELLARYRRKEPLNGIILAVGADRLLQDDDIQISNNGMVLRQRINHLMRTLGAKVPVFLLVTKMDLVFGFDDFSRTLDPEKLDQAMGYINVEKKTFWKDIFSDALESISARLEFHRFNILHASETASPQLLFPGEFRKLSARVSVFLESVFKENAYQETPLLRGLFFASALRKGQPLSEFISLTGITPEDVSSDMVPNRGLYLKDFFSRILPADRKIHTPLAEYALWKRITSNLALSAWLLFCVLAAGTVGASWMFNRSVINQFRESFSNYPVLTGDMQMDLMMMEKFRDEIVALEKKNRSWILPSMGFSQRIDLENAVMKQYCMLFNKEFVETFDKDLLKSVDRGVILYDNQPKADLFGYLVLRIVTLQSTPAAHDGWGENDFIPLASHVLMGLHPEVEPEVAEMFGGLYYSYIRWNDEKAGERLQWELLQNTLVNHMKPELRGSMEWLASMRELEQYDIHLGSLWRSEEISEKSSRVILHGAYTGAGRARIRGFVKLLNLALDDRTEENTAADTLRAELPEQTNSFWKWYGIRFYDEWQQFITSIPSGIDLLESPAEWKKVALTMVSASNPYMRALDMTSREIGTFNDQEHWPAWATRLMYVSRIRQLAAEVDASQAHDLKGAVAEGTLQTLQLGNKARGKAAATAFADTLHQAKAWSSFYQALTGIPLASMSEKQIAEAYAACFSYDTRNSSPQTASPFLKLYESVNALGAAMNMNEGPQTEDPVFSLLFGPLDYLLKYAGDESSAYLQQQWDEAVLGGLVRENSTKMAQQLFGAQNGSVWAFVKGPALPFLVAGPEGFRPRYDFMDNHLAFTGEFFNFLNQGAALPQNIQSSYMVSLTTLPVSANPDAYVQPVSVRLETACADKPFVLENFNYPIKGTINWSPENCGLTKVTIGFPEFSITKTYPGSLGFVHFLDDMRDGQHRYTADEFPDRKGFLSSSNINSVTVAYEILGSEPVLRFLNSIPGTVPDIITLTDRP